MAMGSRTLGRHECIIYDAYEYTLMDSIEIASAMIGSAIMLAMFGLAARKSWIDRKETERQLTDRTGQMITA
jgi:hypothetical protein